MDERDRSYFIGLIALVVGQYASACFRFEEFFTDRHRGALLTQELLHGHERRFFESTRMNPETFDNLLHWLRMNTPLSGSKYIELDEKVMIFLHIVGHGASMRNAGSLFCHSNETISRYP